MQCNKKVITTIKIIQEFFTYLQDRTPISAEKPSKNCFRLSSKITLNVTSKRKL
jgi:hypothetical protein